MATVKTKNIFRFPHMEESFLYYIDSDELWDRVTQYIFNSARPSILFRKGAYVLVSKRISISYGYESTIDSVKNDVMYISKCHYVQ